MPPAVNYRATHDLASRADVHRLSDRMQHTAERQQQHSTVSHPPEDVCLAVLQCQAHERTTTGSICVWRAVALHNRGTESGKHYIVTLLSVTVLRN
jgi:hypothetical protein